jgi:hypothetical protein
MNSDIIGFIIVLPSGRSYVDQNDWNEIGFNINSTVVIIVSIKLFKQQYFITFFSNQELPTTYAISSYHQ